jgi:putative pyrogenic exotoxin B
LRNIDNLKWVALTQQQDVYIVNFKNNRGYLITSADKRVPGIFAYNDTGHLGYPNIWLKNTINGTSTEINNGNLLYIRGTKKPNTDGHAWVVDGVKRNV